MRSASLARPRWSCWSRCSPATFPRAAPRAWIRSWRCGKSRGQTGVRPRPWRRLGSDPDLGGDWGQTPTLAATGVRPRPWRRLGSDPDVAGDWGQTPTLRATGVRPRPLGRPGSDPAADRGADLLDHAIDR